MGDVEGALALVVCKTTTEACAHDVEGLDVRAGYLHDLAASKRLPIVVGPAPEPGKCAGGDARFICRHGTGR